MLKKPGSRSCFNSVFVLLLLLFYFGLATADEEIEATAEYSKGARQCMTCHREGRDPAAHEVFLTPMGISNAEKSPFAEGSHDCETCHGPSASHRKKQEDGSRLSPAVSFAKGSPAGPQNEVCMGCHNDGNMIHWTGSMHDEEEVALIDGESGDIFAIMKVAAQRVKYVIACYYSNITNIAFKYSFFNSVQI